MQHIKFLNLYILVIMLVCCEFFCSKFCNALLLSVMESFYIVYHCDKLTQALLSSPDCSMLKYIMFFSFAPLHFFPCFLLLPLLYFC